MGVQSVRSFLVNSWTVFEFVAVKKFGKELANDDQHIAVKLILVFIRQNHNEGIYSLR